MGNPPNLLNGQGTPTRGQRPVQGVHLGPRSANVTRHHEVYARGAATA
jgi:hypothetical protein